jgi:sugar-specific transcriptional regulator TrmB
MALVRKGFAEVSDAGSPMRYRITPIGRAALEKEKQS